MDDITIHTKPCPEETKQQHEEWHKQLVQQILVKLEAHDVTATCAE